MIKRALISVSDKMGVVSFAKILQTKYQVEILSTGGTLKVLAEAGVKVTPVDDYTGYPEMMNGRVKTLHPKIHGGLLALRENSEHMEQASQNVISMIDLVCVNLYPFEETIKKEGVTLDEAIENIDIGGPSMLRSAAKNYQSVIVLSDVRDYQKCTEELENNKGEASLEFKKEMALKVFYKTAKYDAAITEYLSQKQKLGLFLEKKDSLRYGENPHLKGSIWNLCREQFSSNLVNAKLHQGKAMSFLNYYDADAALEMVRRFPKATATCVKHANPCGIASAETIEEAFLKSYEADSRSAFGVIIALNKTCSAQIVELILDRKIFVEVLIAPNYELSALELLKQKPNIRVLEIGDYAELQDSFDIKKINGGVLLQDINSKMIILDDLTFVTSIKPTEQQLIDLLFAANTVKYVKSNAIVLVKNEVTVGIGAGQMSRVDSTEIAVRKSGEKAQGSVLASDAFFPFADSIEEAHKYGISAIIQPGGSIRDDEVIAKANELNMPMVMTGVRMFKH